MVDAAEKEFLELERGGVWRPPPPLMSPPPPPTRDDPDGIDCDSDAEDEERLPVQPESLPRTLTNPQIHELPRTLTIPQEHELPPRPATDPQLHELPPRTITDPHVHDPPERPGTGARTKVGWAPLIQSHPQPVADMHPPTDPQLHDFPSPPPSW